ncbi:MAG: hypothetical protein V4495_27675 [Pseudomonadota bacterium]
MTKTNPSFYRIVLVLLSALHFTLLGGCATREKLTVADVPEQIVLTTQVSYKSKAFSGMKWEYIALPGIYDAERKDDGGVYFYGNGRSIVEIGELYGNVPRLKVGGIYVPHDKSLPVQMIFAFENKPTTTNDLNQYIQDRTITTTLTPQLRPGIGAGANIVGNVAAGVLVSAMLQAGEGEITRVTIKDQDVSNIIRTFRGPKIAKVGVEPSKAP